LSIELKNVIPTEIVGKWFMSKTFKTWTALGLGLIATAGLAQGAIQHPIGFSKAPTMLVLAAAAGEGAGEGGGIDTSTSYALQSTDSKAYQYDASKQIDAYIDLVASAYVATETGAKSLESAVTALLDKPSAETLAAARKAWIGGRPAYLKTEAFRFYGGPIDAVEGELNSWPMNEAYLDYVEGNPKAGLVNDPVSKFDKETLEGLNQKQDEKDVTIGWHAIEFLLWGQDLSATGPGNRPFTDYIAGKDNNDKRRAYLLSLTKMLTSEVHGLVEQWELSEKGSYANAFKKLPPREAVGRIVNGMAILAGYEFRHERLSVALDSGDQEDEHSGFSDNTKRDFIFDMKGIKQVWTGDDGITKRHGLRTLLLADNAALVDKVDALMDDTEAKIDKLGDPWDQVLAKPPGSPERQAGEDVVTALGALADGIKEAGNKLGVLVLIPSE
jgi:putative iron-regulated protein